jgi:hypothetical protein
MNVYGEGKKVRKLWASITVVLLVAGVASAMGQQSHPYTSSHGRFTIKFPAGQIEQETRDLALQGTDKTTLNEFSVVVHNGPESDVYIVDYADYPPKYTKGGPQDVLAASRNDFVAGMTLVSDKAIDLNGVPGREFTASDDQSNHTVRMFLKGQRLYWVIIVSSKGMTATLASQFLNSFKIQ